MSRIIDIFVELGNRLSNFGDDPTSAAIIDKAIQANEWFSRKDILMAVDAIREEMLNKEKLQKWLAHYPRPCKARRVAIIMAGNLPLVGFFDLLCVIACGYTAIVKSSGKDKILMQYIINILQEICPAIAIEEYCEEAQFDMVIATGGDVAARHFQMRYADIPALIRGSRHSVAVLSGNENSLQMRGLQQDIYSYNGLGCRNISLIFIPKEWIGTIPCSETPLTARRGNYLTNKALLTMTGAQFIDLNDAIAIESRSLPDALSTIHYSTYENISEVEQWLVENDTKIQCIVSTCISHPRRVDFGRAQYPTLWDYADGVDVIKFLTD